MKKFFLFSLITLAALIVPSQAFSQDNVSNSQKRIEEIQTKVATGSANTQNDSTFIEGQIVALKAPTIIISTSNGSRIVYTSDNTQSFNINSTGKKHIGIGDLKVGNVIMVLGLPGTTNSGTAKFIVRDTTKQIATFSILGKIVNTKSSTLTLQDLSRSDFPATSITLSKDTVIKASDNKDLTSTGLQKGDELIAAGTIDSKGNLVPKTVLKIVVDSSKTASSSAQ